MKDKEFSKALKKGCVQAYKTLYARYYQTLCRYVFGLCKDADIAEDIVQDTMIRVWNHRHRIDEDYPIYGYLFRICHNEFLLYIRKKKRERLLLEEFRAEAIFENSIESTDKNTVFDIKDFIPLVEKLPSRCREVFVLSKFEKLKYKEIALEMNISEKTVEAHMSKAYVSLRKYFYELKKSE